MIDKVFSIRLDSVFDFGKSMSGDSVSFEFTHVFLNVTLEIKAHFESDGVDDVDLDIVFQMACSEIVIESLGEILVFSDISELKVYIVDRDFFEFSGN